ncbi:glutathione S-transferase C-terminal domain-containing protein [Pseudonocardia ailaonensis]|uniref:Glutathione S-transferase C-terminal domain-containing protein n=1 Tax=Pseudonocardia ailaonensis TaxID=367279 RepID=A0ABN2N0L7_9PSEU
MAQEFVRAPLGVQERITADGSSPWPVEAGRYRLVVARACPWANRTVIVRRLLGLEPVLSMGIAGPLHDERSWRFHNDPGDRDPVLGIEWLRDAYEKAIPGYDKGVTVPAVVEVASGKVVTNAYKELEFDLATQWTAHHREGAPDLFPEAHRDEIEALSEQVFHDVNNGVYKCGFAGSQAAYDRAHEALFARLDALSERLADRRYLVGDTITEADVRLWVTLVRFDAAYHGHFKANRQKLTEMPVLWAYARDLFQTPGFGDTIDFAQIKQHYYGVHRTINPTGIVPRGPLTSGWLTPHGREALGGRPFGDGTPPGPPLESECVPPLT